jgi:hypothetical protein
MNRKSSHGLAQPLPLAGEVGAKCRVGTLSTLGLSPSGNTPTPALPRKREREHISLAAPIKPNPIIL